MKSPEQRFWERVDKNGPGGCWVWTTRKTPIGRPHLQINGHTVTSARFSWELANGPIPDGMQVCHNCPNGDNGKCVNPAHLWLGTNAENMLDRNLKHRTSSMPGEKNRRAKLTETQVLEILRRYSFRGMNGESGVELSKIFGVSATAIWKITNGMKWKHINLQQPKSVEDGYAENLPCKRLAVYRPVGS